MKSRDDRIAGPKPLANSAARRVEAIIEGAERAAERVIDDAEANARAYLAEAEAEADRAVAARLAALGDLTDALVAQADAIRRQSELLTRSLREAKEKLESAEVAAVADPDRGGEEVDQDEEQRAPYLAAVEVEAPEPDQPDQSAESPVAEVIEHRGSGAPAGARLLATQMAVSGSSREEIAARLRNGFEIEDPDAILDAILGPEA